MVKNKNNSGKIVASFLINALFIMQFSLNALAQEENLSAPLPGGIEYNRSQKVQDIHKNVEPILTTNSEKEKEKSIFLTGMSCDKYPISITGLKTLIDNYKQEVSHANFDADTLDPILAWLEGLMKAHNRLALAFAKQSDLKSAFDNECSLIRQLRSIKNEILYIKVQELIKGKKLKQAIPMLIDITCSEPNSALGLKAYQHLRQSGFSNDGNLTLPKRQDDLKVDKEQ